MATIRKTQTMHYDQYMNTRQRVVRFLSDNADTYLDYPENTLRRVDQEDVEKMNYYRGSFGDYCFYGGFTGVVVIGGGAFALHKMQVSRGLKLVSLLLPLFPMLGSTYLHYSVTGKFLDYCAVKYQDRGLWDVELWDYHKSRHAENEMVAEWTIGK